MKKDPLKTRGSWICVRLGDAQFAFKLFLPGFQLGEEKLVALHFSRPILCSFLPRITPAVHRICGASSIGDQEGKTGFDIMNSYSNLHEFSPLACESLLSDFWCDLIQKEKCEQQWY